MLFFVTILIYTIKNIKDISFKTAFKSPLFIYFFGAFLVLMFAMCIPLRFSLFRPIVDVLGPLKQFRILGRFAWIFFYVFTVFLIVLLYRIRQKQKKIHFYNGLFILGIVLFFIEFHPTHSLVSKDISKTKNPFKIEYLEPELREIVDLSNQKDYDAIIFLPFTHLSSESVFILGSEHSSFESLMLSYHTNTPLLNTMSSRTALPEAVSMINLFSPEFIEKEIAKTIGYDKKILLVKNNDGLDKNEQRMVWSSNQFFQNETFTLYDFSFKDWNSDFYFNDITEKSKQANRPLEKGWRADTTTWFYYDSFEDTPDRNAMTGNGAFAQQKIGWNRLIELNADILEDGDYTLSFWYNIDIGRPDVLAVAEKVSLDTTEWVDKFMIRETNLIVENWAYVELNFNYKSTDQINILLTSGPSNDWMVVDELLIRKQDGADLFKTGNFNNQYIKRAHKDYLIYNNYWIDKSSFE
jgi:hypothetical protein